MKEEDNGNIAKLTIIDGDSIERVGGKYIEYVGKGTYSSGQRLIITAAKGKFFGGNPDAPPIREKTRVKTIECITPLDEGSKNDGSGTEKQKGIVYGKTYYFKVTEYTNEEPVNSDDIKWAISYTDVATGVYVENNLEDVATGFEISIRFNGNVNSCGTEITIKAYIEDIEKEGKLPIWKHNRFRWFDTDVLKKEIEERKTEPWLANQNNTSTCGIAAVLYILAKKDFEKYKKFVLTLHRTGVANCNNYKINVDESEHLLEMDPTTNVKYPSSKGKMPYVDWISFSCIRDKENEIRNYDGENDEFSFDGSTVPREIKKLMVEILNFSSVTDNTNVIFNKGTLFWDGEDSPSREVARMQELYLEGYSICMLINTNMLSNKESGILTPIEHCIVFEGLVNETITSNLYNFEVFTWGEIRNVLIQPSVFSTNYYGYVYGK